MKIKLLISALVVCAFSTKEIALLEYPSYFPKPVYDAGKNSLSIGKINLGRALFYDPLLSKNNTISCASCHSPYNAFAHSDHALSHGINDSTGTRNAPALMNLAWHKNFMWDGAINHIDVQALAPISHPREMGESLANVVKKLRGSTIYPSLFRKAFGDTAITGQYVLKALAQFQMTLVSANSKYDKVKQGKEKFTEQEEHGYALFKQYCNSCHSEPLFSSYEFACNGLPMDTLLRDHGKWNITKSSKDSMKFKIPALRNLSYSAPYMHDGRFKKLREVINHYTSINPSLKTLDASLRKPVALSSDDKDDLIAFLMTLNDKDFVFNPKHQFPKEILLSPEGNKK